MNEQAIQMLAVKVTDKQLGGIMAFLRMRKIAFGVAPATEVKGVFELAELTAKAEANTRRL